MTAALKIAALPPADIDEYLLRDRSHDRDTELVNWWHLDISLYERVRAEVDDGVLPEPDRLDLVAWVYARLVDGDRVVFGHTGVVASYQPGGSHTGQWYARTGDNDVYPTHYSSAFTAACAAVDAFLATCLD